MQNPHERDTQFIRIVLYFKIVLYCVRMSNTLFKRKIWCYIAVN